MHSAALADDGTVWTWGVNDEGALGRQTTGEIWEKAVERVRASYDIPANFDWQHSPRTPGFVAHPQPMQRSVIISSTSCIADATVMVLTHPCILGRSQRLGKAELFARWGVTSRVSRGRQLTLPH